MRKVILSVAPTAGTVTTYDPAATADDLINCCNLGATQLHLHVRDLSNKLTADTSVLRQTLQKVRDETDMIIEVSTGGISDLTIEERCAPCYEPLVELTSLNVSTINLGEIPYLNPASDVRYNVRVAKEQNKHPDAEMFELGHIYTLKDLDDEFGLPTPLLLCLVTGYKGTMPATEPALRHMVTCCEEVFPEREYIWGLIQGNRMDWNLIGTALDWGAKSIRVGFEDSPYLSPEKKAETNAQLVEKVIEVMREHDAEPMSPKEARELLGLRQL